MGAESSLPPVRLRRRPRTSDRRRRPRAARTRPTGSPGWRRPAPPPAAHPACGRALEYGCHVRDVHRIFNQRVQLMLRRGRADGSRTGIRTRRRWPTTTPPRIPPPSPMNCSTPPRPSPTPMPRCLRTRGRGADCAATAASSPSRPSPLPPARRRPPRLGRVTVIERAGGETSPSRSLTTLNTYR